MEGATAAEGMAAEVKVEVMAAAREVATVVATAGVAKGEVATAPHKEAMRESASTSIGPRYREPHRGRPRRSS